MGRSSLLTPRPLPAPGPQRVVADSGHMGGGCTHGHTDRSAGPPRLSFTMTRGPTTCRLTSLCPFCMYHHTQTVNATLPH